MSARERPSIASIASPTLIQQLALVLPKDSQFSIYHLSTPPTRTSALYSAPPGSRPDRTYCESHFLAVSIRAPAADDASEAKDVLVYAVEILIYSTAYDSTFFVSKADSTGYLHLLGLAKGTPSPIRDITATFMRHLVEQHQRDNIRSIVSLFARAQDQYLFPGSVEYSGKHVLDDRGLVKWWCRVLHPLIEGGKKALKEWDSVKGYLTVPGLDTHEAMSYIPDRNISKAWTVGHPLQEISRHSDYAPPRCLIPHYPDDPKARFLDELDEEISKSQEVSGHWKSVRSIDQFWDMMAFRQECCAGRMVGFIWIVFEPRTHHQATESIIGDSQSTSMTSNSQTDIDAIISSPPRRQTLITPCKSFNVSSQALPPSSPVEIETNCFGMKPPNVSTSRTPRNKKKKKKKTLTGPIISRQPRVKTESKNYLLETPETSAYYTWPSQGRGQIVVEESSYKRATELLLQLDFANFELATSSSRRWINEVRSSAWGSTGNAWGQTVSGTRAVEIRAAVGTAGVATLNVGLMKKKEKRKVPQEDPNSSMPGSVDVSPEVHELNPSAVRKKAKV